MPPGLAALERRCRKCAATRAINAEPLATAQRAGARLCEPQHVRIAECALLLRAHP